LNPAGFEHFVALELGDTVQLLEEYALLPDHHHSLSASAMKRDSTSESGTEVVSSVSKQLDQDFSSTSVSAPTSLPSDPSTNPSSVTDSASAATATSVNLSATVTTSKPPSAYLGKPKWYRGYVFSSAAGVSPKLGVFPESHIYSRSLNAYKKALASGAIQPPPLPVTQSGIPANGGAVTTLATPAGAVPGAVAPSAASIVPPPSVETAPLRLSGVSLSSATQVPDAGSLDDARSQTTAAASPSQQGQGLFIIVSFIIFNTLYPCNSDLCFLGFVPSLLNIKETGLVVKRTSRPGSFPNNATTNLANNLAPLLNASDASNSSHPPIPNSTRPTHETAAGVREPLADEIAATLREWGDLMKRHLMQRDYTLFNTIKDLFHTLYQGRRQLLSQTLSQEELYKLRRTLVAKLELGNKLQGLDVLVRHPERGHLVGERSSSIVKVMRMHLEMGASKPPKESMGSVKSGTAAMEWALRSSYAALNNPSSSSASGNNPSSSSISAATTGLTYMSGQSAPSSLTKDSMRDPAADVSKLCSLHFELTACTASICLPGEYAELAFFIYNKQESKLVSEEFLVIIDYNGNPRGIGLDDKLGGIVGGGGARLRSLFTDLAARDLCEQTILVCRIVRVGKMNVSDKESVGIISGTAGVSPSAGGGGSPGSLSPAGSAGHLYESAVGYRRPFGCAILELGEVWNSAVSSGALANAAVSPSGAVVGNVAGGSGSASSLLGNVGVDGGIVPREYVMKIYVPSQESNFPVLHELIANKSSGYEISARADQLKVELAVSGVPPPLAQPEILILERTPRLGYPDIIYPGDARNSMYLTLVSGEFSARATALSARNVQVSVQVRLSDGTFIENCILRGLGQFETTYESIVYYHTNTPRWIETLRVDLDPQMFERAHLFFTFRHCSSTAASAPSLAAAMSPNSASADRDKSFFAFAYMPLLRGDHTVINDAQHLLTLYRFDRRLTHPAVYLSYQAGPNILPPAMSSNDNLSAATEALSKAPQLKDAFVVKSLFCSTLMTQSPAILNLLHWRHATAHFRISVETILKDFHFVPDLEVVKFLHGILENIFDMMDSPEIHLYNRLDDLLFQALIFVLSVVLDRRFTAYGVVIDTYIERWFRSTKCWKTMLESFGRLLLEPVKKDVRDAIKVWGYWIRFIVRSGLADQRAAQQPSGTDSPTASIASMASTIGTPAGSKTFAVSLYDMLRGLENLMSLTLPEAILSQTLALQHFPQLLPDLARVYGPVELVSVVVRFADSVRGSKVRLQCFCNMHDVAKHAFIVTLKNYFQ
jgi:hypothetical protein